MDEEKTCFIQRDTESLAGQEGWLGAGDIKDEDRNIQEVEQVAALILMCSPKPICGNLIPTRAMLEVGYLGEVLLLLGTEILEWINSIIHGRSGFLIIKWFLSIPLELALSHVTPCAVPRCQKNPLADAGMLDIFAFYNYKEINFCSL